jgi:dTDP-glucose pyrophosphorylase
MTRRRSRYQKGVPDTLVGPDSGDASPVQSPSPEPRDVPSPREQIVPWSLAAALITADRSIHEAMRRLNEGRMAILLVTVAAGQLVGALTDGDIRRGILAGVEMGDTVAGIMNPAPVSVPIGASRREMVDIMRAASIWRLPVVDEGNRPVRIEILEELFSDIGQHDTVIMAGGLGSRLRPFTDTTPKPLLAVRGKPILDHMLARLRQSGLQDVVISVNYLAEDIMKHVGDGADFGLNVGYLSESERMGTAGSLAQLHPRPTRPFLLANADLLTDMDFARVLEFQHDQAFDIVICVKKYGVDIPYGVVDIDGPDVTAIREKPRHECFVNAGIYVVSPHCIDLVPAGRFFDMTDLVDKAIEKGMRVGAFPVIEYWRDIGTPADLAAAAEDDWSTADNPFQPKTLARTA